jgi:hypothetical protein
MPSQPPKSLLRRTGLTILISFTAVGVLYTYLASTRQPLRTPGVANIERAYSAGGGTASHTPSHGHGEDELNRAQRAQAGLDGVGSVKRDANGPERSGVGHDQRPVQVCSNDL